MATKITKKRERRLSDPKSLMDKRQNMSKTPDKKQMSDVEGLKTSVNSGNPQGLDIDMSHNDEDSDKHETSLGSILAAINSLHVKFDQHTADLRGVEKSGIELEERVTMMEDSVENCTGGISNLSNLQLSQEDDFNLLKEIVIRQQHEINELKKNI